MVQDFEKQKVSGKA